MIKESETFSVWLLVRTEYRWLPGGRDESKYEVRQFHGGALPDPYGINIVGFYLTEAEARAAEALPFPRPSRLYGEPCAWLVILVIVQHSSGDGNYYLSPSYGGYYSIDRDDRDIMAIFGTEAEAQAWVDSR